MKVRILSILPTKLRPNSTPALKLNLIFRPDDTREMNFQVYAGRLQPLGGIESGG